jgi:hypothetical protein
MSGNGQRRNSFEHADLRRRVQEDAGIPLAVPSPHVMSNVFMAGPELVRWDVTACGDNGPYRLVIRHAHGSIVEYFHTSTEALDREAELEELLIAARGGRPLPFGAIA